MWEGLLAAYLSLYYTSASSSQPCNEQATVVLNAHGPFLFFGYGKTNTCFYGHSQMCVFASLVPRCVCLLATFPAFSIVQSHAVFLTGREACVQSYIFALSLWFHLMGPSMGQSMGQLAIMGGARLQH